MRAPSPLDHIPFLVIGLFSALSLSATASALGNTNDTGHSHSGTHARRAPLYSSVIAFGASYQDNGHPRASQYASSLQPPPYVGGRKTNGPVMGESLATNLGATLVDYAYVGAQIDNSLTYKNLPASADQVNQYLADLQAGKVARGKGRVLHVIWNGINPTTAIWSDEINGKTSAATARTRITQNSQALLSQLNKLWSSSLVSRDVAGVDFLVITIPPLATVPTFYYQTVPTQGNQAQLNEIEALTKQFNSEIYKGAQQLAAKNQKGKKVLTWDIVPVWEDMTKNPSKYNLRETFNPCLNSNTNKPCSNPTSYLYWDTLHPTTSTFKKLADILSPRLG